MRRTLQTIVVIDTADQPTEVRGFFEAAEREAEKEAAEKAASEGRRPTAKTALTRLMGGLGG